MCPVMMPTDIPMPQDHNDEFDDQMRIFSPADENGVSDEPIDLEEDAFQIFEASMLPEFEEALEAIQDDSVEPRMLTGFSDMGGNDLRKLKPVWNRLPEESRVTIADHVLALGLDDLFLDFQRFYRMMLDDDAAAVREAGASGLVMYENDDLIDPLVELLTSDPATGVRVASAETLASFTTLAEFMELPERFARKLRKELMGIVNDTNEPASLRSAALSSAAVWSEDNEIRKRVGQFYASDDEDLRIGAIRAMGRASNSQWVPMLDTAARSNDPEVRLLAARALGAYESEVVPILTMLVREDTEVSVRLEAIQALGSVGGRRVLESLQTLRNYVSDDEIEAVDTAIMEAESLIAIEEGDPESEFGLDPDEEL